MLAVTVPYMLYPMFTVKIRKLISIISNLLLVPVIMIHLTSNLALALAR